MPINVDLPSGQSKGGSESDSEGGGGPDSEEHTMPNIEPGTPAHDILTHLAENQHQAFTQAEIHDRTNIDYERVGTILPQLERLDVVRQQGNYWRIEGDDRLAAYNAMTSASSTSVTDDFYGESK